MVMTSSKSSISLSNFFIFNSTYGPREGQENQKILFYHPPDVDIDTKIKNVGLCEAICKFTGTFSDKPCQALHTQKTRQLFYQPEKEFWMIMTINIPSVLKTKEGQPYSEYHDDDVQDPVYEAVMVQAHQMFKLFMGSYKRILEKSGVEGLKQRLEHFFSRYLLTLRLGQADILDVFSGIHFLPLDKNTYLRIQSFINLLEASFVQVQYTAFLYNDQLVWSGLEQDDMRVMYRYLTTSLIPASMEHELKGQGLTSQPVSSVGHYGRFITGPPNLFDERNMGKIPSVFLSSNCEMDELEECNLLVYKALSSIVCLLLDSKFAINFEYLRRLDNFLGPKMSQLASDIGEQFSKKNANSGSEVPFKYIYFNHMNLATKTTVHIDHKRSNNVNIPPDVLRTVADLNHDFSKDPTTEDEETMVKTSTDYWVVGKKSDQRAFYVILNQKNANLIEIHEEVKRLCASNFSNIFFLD